jgi:hypothetical protein
MKVNWLPFQEARDYARSLNLDTFDAWRNYVKAKLLPKDIPGTPHRIYKDKGWVGYPDWLGTGTIDNRKKHSALPPFDIACIWAKSTGIEWFDEWKEVSKLGWLPFGIPKNPPSSYKKEWNSWPDFLGMDRRAKGSGYLSYNQARKFVRTLKIPSLTDWRKYWIKHVIPDNIPLNPSQAYANNGWISWGDFLGGRETRKWWPYERSKKFLKKFNLKNKDDFKKFKKSEKMSGNIPLDPQAAYKNNGWISWGDFLNSGNLSPTSKSKQFLPFKEAIKFIHKLKIKSKNDWPSYCKSGTKPDTIPSSPRDHYKKEWISWGDWLGTGSIATQNKEYLTAKEAKPLYQKLFKEYGINNGSDWIRFAKTHGKLLDELHLPSKFKDVYSKERFEKRKINFENLSDNKKRITN